MQPGPELGQSRHDLVIIEECGKRLSADASSHQILRRRLSRDCSPEEQTIAMQTIRRLGASHPQYIAVV